MNRLAGLYGSHPEKHLTRTLEGLELSETTGSYVTQLQNIHPIELLTSYYSPTVVIQGHVEINVHDRLLSSIKLRCINPVFLYLQYLSVLRE